MNFETIFLTNYGLQNYVSFSRSNGVNVFSIKGSESPKMVKHARGLISEMYGGSSTIVVN
jgi:sulfur transfer protein SufE